MSDMNLQCILGLQCNDFTMLAADQVNSMSIVIMKTDEDKLHKISEKLMMAAIGDTGDTSQFSQYIAKNIQLYKMRNGYDLDTEAIVHFTRRNLAESLRTGSPYLVNTLIGGHDDTGGAQLYYMDYLASCMKVPFAAHGFGGFLSLSILERYRNPDATVSEAYEVIKRCVREVHQRLFINLPNFQVVAIGKNGIERLPVITAGSFVV